MIPDPSLDEMNEGAKALIGRRGFLRHGARGATKVALVAGLLYGFNELRSRREMPRGARGALGIVRPPGSLEEASFLARCIRCTSCADACGAGCVRFFGPEAGDLYATPYIAPAEKGCTLCLDCGPACPVGAIKPLEDKEQVRMGIAVVDERLCVSHNGTGLCGACLTICPLRNRAITQDFRNAPRVHEKHCAGCGLCEEVCIVRERRAIRVVTKRRVTMAGGVEVSA